MKIDIGCGNKLMEGWTGIDISPTSNAEIIRDVDKHGLPFSDNTIDELRAESVFEHFNNFIFVMDECWRVLKPEGKIIIIVPHWASEGAYRDPTHVRYFDTKTFTYFEEGKKQRLYGFKLWKVLACFRGGVDKFGNGIVGASGGTIYCEMKPIKENNEKT